MACFRPDLVMSLLKVFPTAMGLIPLSFLLKAIRLAPKKMAQISSGILLLRTKLLSLMMDCSSLLPASVAPTRFLRCPGFKPSGLKADSAGKEMMADFNESEENGK